MFESQFINSIGWWRGLAALAAAAALSGYFAWHPAGTPAKKERRRRLKVNTTGQLAEGTVGDFHSVPPDEGEEPQELIFYRCSVGGVEYSAAQDVAHRGLGEREVPAAQPVQFNHHLRRVERPADQQEWRRAKRVGELISGLLFSAFPLSASR